MRLGHIRLAARAGRRSTKAGEWLDRGNGNLRTQIESFHLDDVARGRAIDPEALAFERRMAFLVDELYDEDGSALEAAAARWEIAQRPDRAAFIRALGWPSNDLTTHRCRDRPS